MTIMVRAIRGANVVEADTPEEIARATQELLVAILTRNELTTDSVISVLFTATEDLTSAFPASAAREVGFGGIPLICAQEIPVVGSMPRVVRIMMHVHTSRTRSEIDHVYLGAAQSLRADLDN